MPGRVVKATLPGSSPVTWYATLKHRIYGLGQRPVVVVVVAPQHVLWTVRPVSALDTLELLATAGTTDDRIQRQMGVVGWAGVPRAVDLGRQAWRAVARDALARAVNANEPGQARNTFVVGVERTNPLLRGFERAEGWQDAPPANSPQATILPELIDLARSHGSAVVFAELPIRGNSRDAATEARHDQLREWVRSRGAAYIHFPKAELEFRDDLHVTEATAAQYTEHLGRATAEWLAQSTQ